MREPPYGALEAVLLDLGNTLVGMDAAFAVDALAAEGVATTPERFRRAEAAARPALSAWIATGDGTVPTSRVYVRAILDRLGVDRDGVHPALEERLLTRLRSVPTERLWSAVLPGVPQALSALRRTGLRLVVVSNSDGTAEAGLVASGLRGLLDGVVDSTVFGVEKPDRRIFAHALELVGVAPEHAVHVGDLHAVDVVGAVAAGIHAVLLDPFGDWPDMGCATASDLGTLAARIVDARG